jgi:hypothetical protein
MATRGSCRERNFDSGLGGSKSERQNCKYPSPTLLEQLYCLRTISKSEYLATAGRKLRLQKLLQAACRQASFETEMPKRIDN